MNISWVRAEEDMMNPEYDAPRCAQCNEPYRHDSVSTEENLCSMKCAAIWLKDCGECYICGGTCTHGLVK